MTTVTTKAKISGVESINKDGSKKTTGKIQISNQSLSPYIGRIANVTIEVEEIPPEDKPKEGENPTQGEQTSEKN
jgi:hypothetical protein